MTESEAIKELQQYVGLPFEMDALEEAAKIAIQALEEVQKYREIGSIEECRALREKQMPKKPVRKLRSGMGNDYKDYYCTCGRFIGYEPEVHNYLENGKLPFSYCCDCGQKLDLDWSDEE